MTLFSKWCCPNFRPEESALLQREFSVPSIVADILAARGMNAASAAGFLLEQQEPEDPFLLPDMEKAVSRLEQAVNAGECIAIYGDYDCDGVTATVMLYQYLLSVGANVRWYIPERLDEGYGLNCAALDIVKEWGTALLVTVDNGVSAIEEVEYARNLGMDVIVTDHHQVGKELPSALAVINPHRSDYEGSFPDLCGAGVAFKLIAAMEGGYEMALDAFGALAAIGTVGDIVPLYGENRWLVEKGLQLIEYTDNPGLQALMKTAGMNGKPVTAQKIAFGIAPRLNAAGRMGSAKLAVQLLLAEIPEDAAFLAEELNEKNSSRQDEEERILKIMEQEAERDPGMLLNRVLVFAAPGINHGVVGIVSAKLLALYGKPNIILSIEGETAVGSARSVEGFSIFKALSFCSDLLVKYGGHSMAAGMTLKTADIPAFVRRINQYAAEYYDQMPVVCQRIDKVLHAADITLDTVSALQLLEPYGERNPQPLFLLKNCRIEAVIPLSENRHIKLKVSFEGKSIFVLYFKMSTDRFFYPVGSMVDILANLERNSFKEHVSIAVRLKDIRPSDFQESKFVNALHYYEKIRREEPVEPKILARSVPEVEELRWLYKLLRAEKEKQMPVDQIYICLAASRLNYCKFRLMLDIFSELKLISVPADSSSVKLLDTGKVDLEASRILTWLRQQL